MARLEQARELEDNVVRLSINPEQVKRITNPPLKRGLSGMLSSHERNKRGIAAAPLLSGVFV